MSSGEDWDLTADLEPGAPVLFQRSIRRPSTAPPAAGVHVVDGAARSGGPISYESPTRSHSPTNRCAASSHYVPAWSDHVLGSLGPTVTPVDTRLTLEGELRRPWQSQFDFQLLGDAAIRCRTSSRNVKAASHRRPILDHFCPVTSPRRSSERFDASASRLEPAVSAMVVPASFLKRRPERPMSSATPCNIPLGGICFTWRWSR